MERESGSLLHCFMYSRWGLKLAQAQVIGDGPLAQIVFSPQEVLDYREQKRTEDAAMRRAMMLGLFQRGIFLNPVHLLYTCYCWWWWWCCEGAGTEAPYTLPVLVPGLQIGTKFYMSLRHTEADMDAFHARLNDTFEAIVG